MWKHICREQRETLSIPDVSDIAIKIRKVERLPGLVMALLFSYRAI